jgi:hypothetical protein
VERPDPDRIEHALVPPEAAEQMLTFFPKGVRFFNRADNPIGFMSDEDVRVQQVAEAEAEARGETSGEEESGASEGAGDEPSAEASSEGPPSEASSSNEGEAQGG